MVNMETPPLNALEDFERVADVGVRLLRVLNTCPGFWQALERSGVPDHSCGGLKWWEDTLDHVGVVVGRFKEWEAVARKIETAIANGGV